MSSNSPFHEDDEVTSVTLSPLYIERPYKNLDTSIDDSSNTTGSGAHVSSDTISTPASSQVGGKSGIFGASFNFANSIVGAGIIGIPYAVMQCGFYTGILMMFIVAIVVYNAVVMLIECGIRVDKLDLEEISLFLLGDKGYLLALTVMFMFGFGAMIAYMVIVGDTIPAVAEQLFSADNIFANRTFSMMFVGVVVMLPLCLLKDLSSLSWASMISLLSDVVIITCICIYAPIEAQKPDNTAVSGSELSIFSSGIFAGIGAISFAFVCQHNSFMVFRSLKEPTLENWKKVSCYSLVFALSLSICIGMTGYLCFGESTKGDLLNNFPSGHFAMNVCRSLLACCMSCTYPMECYVARHCLLKICHRYGSYCPSICGVNISAYLDGSVHSPVTSRGGSFTILSSSDHSLSDNNAVVSRNHSNSSSSDSNINSNTSNNSSCSLLNHPSLSHLGTLYLTITLTLWTCSIAIAISARNLGIVLSLTGCAAASFLGYILPALVYISSFQIEFSDFLSYIKKQPLGLAKHYYNSSFGSCFNKFVDANTVNDDSIIFRHVNRFSICIFMIVLGILLFFMGISTVVVQNTG